MLTPNSAPRAHSLQEFLRLFSRSNEEARQRLLTEVFQTGQTLQAGNQELTTQIDAHDQLTQECLTSAQQEISVVLTELRRELARRDQTIVT
ncbi:hypothetical protein K3495_g10796 [Podosphaera aphanis]|nr:hypothetical protein K3495_g10796 [Podosphaera aphanis]